MIAKLSELLNSIGFSIEAQDDKLLGRFTIDGETSALVVRVLGSGEGTILNFEVVGLIPPEEVRASDHIGAFVNYLLAHNWRFSAGSIELDTDGEIRILVELPLADAQVTANQLRLIIQILGRNGSELLRKGRHVLQTGKEPEEPSETSSAADSVTPDMVDLFVRFRGMAQTAEGRAALMALKAQSGVPTSVRIMVEAALQQAIPDEL